MGKPRINLAAMNMPWLAFGDFSEILSPKEKLGGRPIKWSRALCFNDMLNNCCLTDLGFTGPQLTWSNLRSAQELIQERLDRVVANPSWRQLFPNAEVRHFPCTQFDHCPVILHCNPRRASPSGRPFRFGMMWMNHPSFRQIVKDAWRERDNVLKLPVDCCMRKACQWNNEVFVNIFHEKRRLLARLEGIQRELGKRPSDFLIQLDKSLVEEYQLILRDERELCLLKCRRNRLLEGERNKKFFHISTLINRRFNKISGKMRIMFGILKKGNLCIWSRISFYDFLLLKP